MKIAKIFARSCAYIIDTFFLLAFTMFVVSFGTTIFNLDESAFQVLPFIAIQTVVFPMATIIDIATRVHGKHLYTFVLSSFFIIEVLYNFTAVVLPTKATLGQAMVGVRVSHMQDFKFKDSLIRSIIKTTSRYLLWLPFVSCLFSKKKQALHDIIAKTSLTQLSSGR